MTTDPTEASREIKDVVYDVCRDAWMVQYQDGSRRLVDRLMLESMSDEPEFARFRIKMAVGLACCPVRSTTVITSTPQKALSQPKVRVQERTGVISELGFGGALTDRTRQLRRHSRSRVIVKKARARIAA